MSISSQDQALVEQMMLDDGKRMPSGDFSRMIERMRTPCAIAPF